MSARVLGLWLGLLLIGLIAMPTAAMAQGEGWFTPGGDTGNTYYAPVNLPVDLVMKENPVAEGNAPLVVNNGRVYTVDHWSKKQIFAIDLATNKVKWNYQVEGDQGISSVISAEGLIFVLTSGKVYALEDAGDSVKVKWTQATEHNGIWMTYNNSTVIYYDRTTRKFTAFDAVTGDNKWTYAFGSVESVEAQMTAGDGKLFAVVDKNDGKIRLMAFDVNTGNAIWSVILGGSGRYSTDIPVYKDGKVYVDWNTTVSAYDGSTGNKLWSYSNGNYFSYSNKGLLSVNNENVFMVGREGYLIAVDRNTGVEKWKVKFSETNATDAGMPFIATNDKVFVEYYGRFKIYDSKTGTLLRDFRPPNPENREVQYRIVAIAADRVFISDGAFLYTLAPSSSNQDTIKPTAVLESVAPTRISPYEGAQRETSAKFSISESSYVKLEVISSTGGVIRNFDLGLLEAGWVERNWDAKDDSGKPVPYGTYYFGIRLKDLAGNESYIKFTDKIITVADTVAKTRLNANLRKGPGTEKEVITVIPAGTELPILGESGNWYLVNYQGNLYTGYISKSVVTTRSNPGTTPDPTPNPNPNPNPGTGSDPQPVVYTVQPGDTLSKIALKYSLTVHDIVKANNLSNPDMLYVGQKLVIPSQTSPQPPSGGAPSGSVYTVQAGDTLWGIARKYNVTVDAIVKANNLDPNKYLYVGQKLTIPGSNTTTPPQPLYYTVQAGDTLWKIAQKYNTTVSNIAQLNNIDPNKPIYVGQKLRVR